jgi:hypothetical protein
VTNKMSQVDGIVLGAEMEHALGVCFVDVDVRVTAMDRSNWPSPTATHASYSSLNAIKRFWSSIRCKTDHVD